MLSEEVFDDMERGYTCTGRWPTGCQVWVNQPIKLPPLPPLPGDFHIEKMPAKVGMNTCVSIRGKNFPGERCTAKIKDGEWCGKHRTTQIRFVEPMIEHIVSPRTDISVSEAAGRIHRAWSRWISRRAGPLLWAREDSNNPFDFFSGDPITEIKIGDFVSFVSDGKGYVMDIKSAKSLLEHAVKTGEAPTNPFNRVPLSALFLRRLDRHRNIKSWLSLQPMTEMQKFVLATTDVFSTISDLGYYTDPAWFMDLTRVQLQQLYIELADVWFHRVGLSSQDRLRIGGPVRPFTVPVNTSLIMQQKALRPLLLNTIKALVSSAAERADRQLGATYVLGSLSLISPGAASAYPYLQFNPGVTHVIGNELIILHPSVLSY